MPSCATADQEKARSNCWPLPDSPDQRHRACVRFPSGTHFHRVFRELNRDDARGHRDASTSPRCRRTKLAPGPRLSRRTRDCALGRDCWT